MSKSRPTIDPRIATIANQLLGFAELRPGQAEAINNLLNGRDTLAVQHTGSGKSAIYQIAGALIEGSTVIISPLIALQKDQVDSINESALPDAAAVNSHKKVGELKEAFEGLERGDVEYIFLAPEQLKRDEMRERLKSNPPSLVVVDEAHCITEWGHDFRPDYLELGRMIEAMGHPPVLALTATASPDVRAEIISGLGMRDPAVIVRGFDRPNIFLRVNRFGTEKEKQEALLKRVQFADKPGLVYAATRKHAQDLAEALADVGVDACWYHGGMAAKEREAIQQSFMNSDSQVMVATNAFGMGIDKSDVRFVYHYDVPDSLDSYYQEVGRCGRDGEPAEAVLFYRTQDLSVPKFLKSGGKVEEADVLKVEQVLQDSNGPVPLDEVHDATNLSNLKVAKAVNRLERIGAVERTETGEAVLSETDIDKAAHDAAEEETHFREHNSLRLEKMQAYAELRSCRREYLLQYFGDEDIEVPCHRCDNCEVLAAVQAKPDPTPEVPDDPKLVSAPSEPQVPFPLNTRVIHSKLGKGVVKAYDAGKIEVLFDDGGRKRMSLAFVTKRRLLQPL